MRHTKGVLAMIFGAGLLAATAFCQNPDDAFFADTVNRALPAARLQGGQLGATIKAERVSFQPSQEDPCAENPELDRLKFALYVEGSHPNGTPGSDNVWLDFTGCTVVNQVYDDAGNPENYVTPKAFRRYATPGFAYELWIITEGGEVRSYMRMGNGYSIPENRNFGWLGNFPTAQIARYPHSFRGVVGNHKMPESQLTGRIVLTPYQ